METPENDPDNLYSEEILSKSYDSLTANCRFCALLDFSEILNYILIPCFEGGDVLPLGTC